MTQKKNNRRRSNRYMNRYLLLIITLICGGMIYFSLALNVNGGPLSSAARFVFVPMQKGINVCGSFISDHVDNLKTLKQVQAENDELSSEVADLTTQIDELKTQLYDLDNYRELYQLDNTYVSYDKVAATVIARDSGNWFDTFTVDRGSSDGIEKGMNVLAGAGLCGIVTEVGPDYAVVRSIIDDNAKVSCMIASSENCAIVSGNLESMQETGTIPFSGLMDSDDTDTTGDAVVTSHVSDEYLPGILIGYVSTIEMSSDNLTKQGTITPVVDFEHIQDVLIITTQKNTGAPEVTDEE